MSLLFLINMGYGAYLLFLKPKYAEQRTIEFKIDPEKTIINEMAKTEANHKSYTFTKYAWAGLLIVSVVCFFIFAKEYFKDYRLVLQLFFLTSPRI